MKESSRAELFVVLCPLRMPKIAQTSSPTSLHFGLAPFSSKYILTILDWLPLFYTVYLSYISIFICIGFPLHVMHFTKLLSATFLLGSAISAPFALQDRENSQMGTWTMNNKCQTNTYFSVWVGGGSPPGPIQTLVPGQSWSEQYQVSTVGITFKLASTLQALNADDILQGEYTVKPDSKDLWYDMSAINDKGGSGMNEYHLTPTQPSDALYPTCTVLDPTNAYQHGGPVEGDKAHGTHTCSIGSDLVLNLCS